jgi:solute:Na+ symporter, SSS family
MQSSTNATIFLGGLLLYIAFLIWLGWYVSRRQKSGEEFLLAGRSLPFFLTLGTTVATLVGTGSSMGAVGFGYTNGWAGTLYGIGGAIGIILLAVVFGGVRRYRFMTMSEELSYYYGANRTIQNVVGVLVLVASVGWLGAHILGGGLNLAWITGIDPNLAKLITALGFGVFVIVGGYVAVVWTDTIQAVVLFVGFILMTILALAAVGGLGGLMEATRQADPDKLSLLGLAKVGLVPGLSLALAVAVGALATPSYRQRIYSAKDLRTIYTSFWSSGLLYLVFSLIPALVGMAAFVLNPGLENRNFAFPYMAVEVFPVAIGVILLIAGLSATMSSASSDAIAGVSILMRDVWVLVTGDTPDKEKVILLSRLGLAGVIGVALLFALITDDIITYITNMISMVLSGLFVASILGRFWKRATWIGGLGALAGSFVASLVVIGSDGLTVYFGNPVIPALVVAMLAGVLLSLAFPVRKPSDQEALAILQKERQHMEMLPELA